jgi:hypothetical protein
MKKLAIGVVEGNKEIGCMTEILYTTHLYKHTCDNIDDCGGN